MAATHRQLWWKSPRREVLDEKEAGAGSSRRFWPIISVTALFFLNFSGFISGSWNPADSLLFPVSLSRSFYFPLMLSFSLFDCSRSTIFPTSPPPSRCFTRLLSSIPMSQLLVLSLPLSAPHFHLSSNLSLSLPSSSEMFPPLCHLLSILSFFFSTSLKIAGLHTEIIWRYVLNWKQLSSLVTVPLKMTWIIDIMIFDFLYTSFASNETKNIGDISYSAAANRCFHRIVRDVDQWSLTWRP